MKLSKFLIQNKIGAKIIIVSEGEVVDFLKHEAKRILCKIFYFYRFRFSLFPQVLATADISLVMLKRVQDNFLYLQSSVDFMFWKNSTSVCI